MTQRSGATRDDRDVRSRILGVDVARACAILGMYAVHLGPTDLPGAAGRLYALPYGRSSLLFVLVAGVGVSLQTTSSTASRRDVRHRLLWRALLLLPLGLALQSLDHGANVILQNYALLFVVAVVVLALPDRLLLGVAAASATLGPVGYWWGQAASPETFAREAETFAHAPGDILHGLVLSGPYPAITWSAPFLVGIWLGRRDLRARRTRRLMAIVGGMMAVTSFVASRLSVGLIDSRVWHDHPAYLLTSGAHSQMPLWLIGGTGAAMLVLSLSLTFTDRAVRLAWPLAATGQLALTAYVGHLLVLHVAPTALTTDVLIEAAALLLGFTVVVVVGATLWRRSFDRGPLERLLTPPWMRTGHSRPSGRGQAGGLATVPSSAAQPQHRRGMKEDAPAAAPRRVARLGENLPS